MNLRRLKCIRLGHKYLNLAVKTANEKLKGYSPRSSDSDHIPGEMIHAGGRTIRSEAGKLVN